MKRTRNTKGGVSNNNSTNSSNTNNSSNSSNNTSSSDTPSNNNSDNRKDSQTLTGYESGNTRCIVFFASTEENKNGDYNWFEDIKIQNSIENLRGIVKGTLERLPYRSGTSGAYARKHLMALVNESGEFTEGLGTNDLAGGALYHLGFRTDTALRPYIYMGNVVVLGKGENNDSKTLNETDVKKIQEAVLAYRNEWESQGDEEEDKEIV